jgi:hypothetical protein
MTKGRDWLNAALRRSAWFKKGFEALDLKETKAPLDELRA